MDWQIPKLVKRYGRSHGVYDKPKFTIPFNLKLKSRLAGAIAPTGSASYRWYVLFPHSLDLIAMILALAYIMLLYVSLRVNGHVHNLWAEHTLRRTFLEITVSYNFSEDERWRASGVYFCLLSTHVWLESSLSPIALPGSDIFRQMAPTPMVQKVGSLRPRGQCSRLKVIKSCSYVGISYSFVQTLLL